MHRLPLLLVAAAFVAAPAFAQHVTVSLGAAGHLPQSDFRDQLDVTGIGLTGAALYGAGPVAAGLEAGWVTYDRDERLGAVWLSDGGVVLDQARSASQIGHVHALVRLQLPEGPIRPYVDGLFGLRHFVTSTTFDRDVVLVSDPVIGIGPQDVQVSQSATRFQTRDTALSYGAGAGLQIRVAQGYDDATPFTAYLDLGARYLFGEEARYGLSAADPDSEMVRVARSRTDVLRPQISLVVQFGR